MSIKIVKSVVAAALLASVASMIAASPASAATAKNSGYDRCPVGTFCAFTEPEGQGAFAYFKVGSHNLANPIGAKVYDNTFSSFWNRTGTDKVWQLFPDPEYRGEPFSVGRGVIQDLPAKWDNQISSLRQL